jgi:hypothetical protein
VCYNSINMGQITIEIPQAVNRTYRIISEDSAKKLLANLERILKKEKAIEDEDILSLWNEPKKLVKKKAV